MGETTGYARMRRGELYASPDWPLIDMQFQARRKLEAYNATPLWEMESRTAQLGEMLGTAGQCVVFSPVTWEYGKHIHLGDAVFINFDCLFLDGADIRIGDGTVVGPRVMFLTAGHPIQPRARTIFHPETDARIGGMTVNRPIEVGKDCWIGAGSIVVGGVTIGEGTVIGAGSVVTRSLPANVLAAGNPCRVIRQLEAGEAASIAAEDLADIGFVTA